MKPALVLSALFIGASCNFGTDSSRQPFVEVVLIDAGRLDAAVRVDAGRFDAAARVDAGHFDAAIVPDGAHSTDAGSDPTADGTPHHGACTSSFGDGLDASYGRLDGYLVSVVAPMSSRDCNADRNHVHLQISMRGAVYDVAVNVGDNADPVGIGVLARDFVLARPWSEGWHTDERLDYTALGVHSNAFTSTAPATVATDLASDLATVNHISVFMTGYGPEGGHLVHRQNGTDGAIVLRPLAADSRFLLFRFAAQEF